MQESSSGSMSFVLTTEEDNYIPRDVLGDISGNELPRSLNTKKKVHIPKLLSKSQNSKRSPMWNELKEIIKNHIGDHIHQSRALDIIAALEINVPLDTKEAIQCTDDKNEFHNKGIDSIIDTPRKIENCQDIISQMKITNSHTGDITNVEYPGGRIVEEPGVEERGNMSPQPVDTAPDNLSIAHRRQRRASLSAATPISPMKARKPKATNRSLKTRDRTAETRSTSRIMPEEVPSEKNDISAPAAPVGGMEVSAPLSSSPFHDTEGADDEASEHGIVHWTVLPPSRTSTPDVMDWPLGETLTPDGHLCEGGGDGGDSAGENLCEVPVSNSLTIAEDDNSLLNTRRRPRRASLSATTYVDEYVSPFKSRRMKKGRRGKVTPKRRGMEDAPKGREGTDNTVSASSAPVGGMEVSAPLFSSPFRDTEGADDKASEHGIVHWTVLPPSRTSTPDVMDWPLGETLTTDRHLCEGGGNGGDSGHCSPVVSGSIDTPMESAISYHETIADEVSSQPNPRRRQRRASLGAATFEGVSPMKARKTKATSSRSLKAREKTAKPTSYQPKVDISMGDRVGEQHVEEESSYPDVDIDDMECGIMHWDNTGSESSLAATALSGPCDAMAKDGVVSMVRRSPRKTKPAAAAPQPPNVTENGDREDTELPTFSSLVSISSNYVSGNPDMVAVTPPREALTRKCFTRVVGPAYIDEAVVAVWMDDAQSAGQHTSITPQYIEAIWSCLRTGNVKMTTCESSAYAVFVLSLACALGRGQLTLADLQESIPELDELQRALLDFSNDASDSLVEDSMDSTGLRKIRFAGLVGECVSPPNDRKPGSSAKFQDHARRLEFLMDSISSAVHRAVHDSQSKLASVVAALGGGLACLANDRELCHEAVRNCQEVKLWRCGRDSWRELSKLSRILCGEFGLKFMSYSMADDESLYESPLSLYLPGRLRLGHRRTALRHRITWVLTSLLRYHLRWFLDETPLRATTVQLVGQFPSVSCRSEAVPRLVITLPLSELPMNGKASSISAPLDMTVSSMLNMALQQIYLGLFECNKFSESRNCGVSSGELDPPTEDIFYSSLHLSRSRLTDWVEETINNSQVDQNDRLWCCQVHDIFTNANVMSNSLHNLLFRLFLRQREGVPLSKTC